MRVDEMLTAPAGTTFDARALNWRFVTPSEPTGTLLLPAEDERISWAVTPFDTAGALAEAFRSGPYPGVAIPDLHRWARIADIDPATLLGAASRSVEAGGWLYAGFANPWYPLRAGRGSLRLGKALAVIRRHGLSSPDVYVVFPDQRRPAYLVPRDGRLELEFFLERFFLPYADGDGARARITRAALPSARRAALSVPHRARVALAPAFAVVAERLS
jgi:hypothetical protein